jgi:hypothetical protein
MRRITLLGLVLASTACSDLFTPSSVVESVRILAVKADLPYAAPGEPLKLEVLAYDGRKDKPAPMKLSWFPELCVNPKDNKLSDCYTKLAAKYSPGASIDAQLKPGETFATMMPEDALSSRDPNRPGAPFGSVYAFVAACAGELRMTGRSADYPDSVPFGCFDASGNALGTESFVFSFARLYAFPGVRNENPVIDGVTIAGAPVTEAAPVTIDHCTVAKLDDCPKIPITVAVPPSSQEPDVFNALPGETPPGEQVWASVYMTAGKPDNEATVLYNASGGAIAGAKNDLFAPLEPGPATLWVVVRDNRSGVSWKRFDLDVK